MILLDTHIWVWLVTKNPKLTKSIRTVIEKHAGDGLGVSAISCWEVAKLVELGKVSFSVPIAEWMEQSLLYPAVQLLEFTPQIAIESTTLPGDFHRDPADQIIVATARLNDLTLLTVDSKILNYAHVKTFSL